MKFIKILLILGVTLLTTSILANNGKPDLWKVEKNGNVSYLFGSIHLGSKDMYPLSDIVNKAYQSTSDLAVEIDMSARLQAKIMPLVQKYGIDTQVPLEKRLSSKGLSIYQKACKEKSLPCQQFSAFKGWLVGTQIATMAIQKLGYSDAFGIDKHFLKLAHDANKSVIGLETIELQFSLLSGLSQETQEYYLIESILAKDADLKILFSAWKNGDDAALIEIIHKDISHPRAKDIYKTIIENRNHNMVRKISANIAKKKSLFVVVGAGHIVGKNGLVDLLRKDGFKLTEIQ